MKILISLILSGLVFLSSFAQNDIINFKDIENAAEFSHAPLNQMPPLKLSGSIVNGLALPANDLNVLVQVYKDGELLKEYEEENIDLLNTGDLKTFDFGTLDIEEEGTYRIDYVLGGALVGKRGELKQSQEYYVGDSTLQRDLGNLLGAYSLGEGFSGLIGQNITLLETDELTSLTLHLQELDLGDEILLEIYSTDELGKPDLLLGQTNTLLSELEGEALLTLSLEDELLLLEAGTYYLGLVHLPDKPFALSYTEDYFTEKSTWVLTDSLSGSDYLNNEELNDSLTYVLRANFGEARASTGTENALKEEQTSIIYKPSSGMIHIEGNELTKDFSIYSMNGSLIYKETYTKPVDVSHLSGGVYLIRSGAAHKSIILH